MSEPAPDSCENQLSRFVLHGRAKDLESIHSASSGVVVLAGDSGIGKSEVLRDLEAGWAASDHVAHPVVLSSGGGSLQNAFVDSLAELLANHLATRPRELRDTWIAITKVVDRGLTASQRQAGRLITARMFAYFEQKFGKEMAEASRNELAELLKASEGGSLSDQIQGLMVPDVATQLLSVAGELAQLLAGRLILRMDRGDYLHSNDLDLLAELADRSIDELLVLLTFSTHSVQESDLVRRLETRGAKVHRIKPILDEDLRVWLRSASVEEALWSQIATITSSYPFFVEEAIRLHHLGQPLEQLRGPDAFAALLHQSWEALSAELQTSAMLLSVFVDPPADDFLAQLLSTDRLTWSTRRSQLVRAGVLIERADSAIWFHDRRRDYLLNQLMDDGDRAEASLRSITVLRPWITDQPVIAPWVTTTLPWLTRQASSRLAADDWCAGLLSLTRDELSILLATIEMQEPNGDFRKGANTVEVGVHARRRCGVPGDPIAAIESLTDKGLVVTSANDRVSIIVPVIPGNFEYAALLGEFEHTLKLRPYPRLGSTIFDRFLRPVLLPFEMALYAIGRGTAPVHRNFHDQLAQRSSPGVLARDLPGLAVDVEFEGQGLAATIGFRTSSERDDARQRLLAYEGARYPSELRVIAARDLPQHRVKHGRYLSAAKLLSGRSTLPSAQAVRGHLDRKRGVFEAIREAIPAIEAAALGLGGPRSVLVDIRDDGAAWAELWVSGGLLSEYREMRFPEGYYFSTDPLRELRLIRDRHLRAGERVDNWIAHSNMTEVDDAMHEVAEFLTEKGRAFNSGLDPVSVSLDKDELIAEIRQERDTQERLLAAIRAVSTNEPSAALDRRSIHLLVQPVESVFGLTLMASTFVADDGEDEITFRMLDAHDERPPFDASGDELKSFGIRNLDKLTSSRSGDAQSVLACLLGYEAIDVALEMEGRRRV
ncbi:hypothetical protein [Herbiconiux liukaitaii]|uniref:hypothetical protein n=1 Tax=Herbiconiux liukaitaii TaxID=3342799 RepID=UPI0035B934D7